jgi:hypothetical protein
MYWFSNSYRKKEAKFQNDLLNERKSEVCEWTVATATPL